LEPQLSFSIHSEKISKSTVGLGYKTRRQAWNISLGQLWLRQTVTGWGDTYRLTIRLLIDPEDRSG